MMINIDVDGVLRDMVTASLKLYKAEYDKKSKLKYKDVIHYDFRKTMSLISDLGDFFINNAEELFYNARPYVGAKDFIDGLQKEGHTIQIVTHQLHGTEPFTIAWLLAHDIQYNSLHFTKDKTKVKSHMLLDDCIDNLIKCKNKHAVCLEQPWNDSWYGTKVKSLNHAFSWIKNHHYIGEGVPK